MLIDLEKYIQNLKNDIVSLETLVLTTNFMDGEIVVAKECSEDLIGEDVSVDFPLNTEKKSLEMLISEIAQKKSLLAVANNLIKQNNEALQIEKENNREKEILKTHLFIDEITLMRLTKEFSMCSRIGHVSYVDFRNAIVHHNGNSYLEKIMFDRIKDFSNGIF